MLTALLAATVASLEPTCRSGWTRLSDTPDAGKCLRVVDTGFGASGGTLDMAECPSLCADLARPWMSDDPPPKPLCVSSRAEHDFLLSSVLPCSELTSEGWCLAGVGSYGLWLGFTRPTVPTSGAPWATHEHQQDTSDGSVCSSVWLDEQLSLLNPQAAKAAASAWATGQEPGDLWGDGEERCLAIYKDLTYKKEGWYDIRCDLSNAPAAGRRLGYWEGDPDPPYSYPTLEESTPGVPRCACELPAAVLDPCDDGDLGLGGVFASSHPGAPEECWELVPYMAAWSGRTEQQLCAATLGELAEFLEAIGADPWTPHEPSATIADVCGGRCGLAGAGTCGSELGPKCSATKALGQAAYAARECADTTRRDVRGKTCTANSGVTCDDPFLEWANPSQTKAQACPVTCGTCAEVTIDQWLNAPSTSAAEGAAKRYATLSCPEMEGDNVKIDPPPSGRLLDDMVISTADELITAVANAERGMSIATTCEWSVPRVGLGRRRLGTMSAVPGQLESVRCSKATLLLLAPGAIITLNGTALDLPFMTAFTIRGVGAAGATIDAGGLSRVLTIGGGCAHTASCRRGRALGTSGGYEGVNVELINVHLTGGIADEGGAVFIDGVGQPATLTMYGGSITASQAVGGGTSETDGGGGGLLAVGSGITIVPGDKKTVTSVMMYGVDVSGGIAATDGGCVLVKEATYVMSGVKISGCNAGRHGGGLFTESSTASTISSSMISHSVAAESGGGYFQKGGSAALSRVVVDTCRTTKLESTLGWYTNEVGGGGVVITDNALVDLIDVSVLRTRGGGVLTLGDSTLQMSGVRIEGGQAKYGAGLAMFGGSTTMRDSSIRGTMTGPAQGGAGMFMDAGARLTCERCEVRANNGSFGGGLAMTGQSTATFRDSVVAQNGAALKGDWFHGGHGIPASGGGMAASSAVASP